MLRILGSRVTFESLTQRGDKFCEQIKSVFTGVYLVRNFCWHNRNHAGNIIKFGSVINALAAPCNDFVSLELHFVNMIFDALVWRDSNEVITECATSIFCGNDVLEFNAFESWVLAPSDVFERLCVARKSEFAVVEFFEKFFFHNVVLLFNCGLRL